MLAEFTEVLQTGFVTVCLPKEGDNLPKECRIKMNGGSISLADCSDQRAAPPPGHSSLFWRGQREVDLGLGKPM